MKCLSTGDIISESRCNDTAVLRTHGRVHLGDRKLCVVTLYPVREKSPSARTTTFPEATSSPWSPGESLLSFYDSPSRCRKSLRPPLGAGSLALPPVATGMHEPLAKLLCKSNKIRHIQRFCDRFVYLSLPFQFSPANPPNCSCFGPTSHMH